MTPLPALVVPGIEQFGPIEMGGMFSVVKVHDHLGANDYKDPGWCQHPEGPVAWEVETSAARAPARRVDPASGKATTKVHVVRPKAGHKGH